jgi:HEAT repeat protein
MKQVYALAAGIFFSLTGVIFGAEIGSAKSETDQRLDTIQYGTETEIAALIQTLKTENSALMDEKLEAELIKLSQNTRNQNILTGMLAFFGERNRNGLEDRAIRAITDREEEAHSTVLAAIDYLGKVKASEAITPLEELLDAQETRYTEYAIRALGRAANGNAGDRDSVAAYLIDLYTNRNPPEENRWEIITALGETGSKEGISLLSELVKNNEERPVIRTAALEGLSKIGDATALDAILQGVSATDPNVRSAAVAALGPFSGSQVDDAILESFRDSYFRTRLGAAKAAGTRKLTSAIPYLRYRAEKDEVPTVKDEALKALGAIGSAESRTVLEELFSERKTSDRVRILAAEMLIQNDAGSYADKVITELDDAKKRNQTALYNGFLKAISAAKTGKVEDLVRRFLNSGGVIEKSYALDMTLTNEFRSFAPDIQALLKDKNSGLAGKARATLEKLGIKSET